MTSNTHGMKWSMLIAHQKGSCVVATYTREVAETKAAQAMNMALEHGCPCAFQTKPDE
jgi:ATP-dependent Clp protease adaptor protein ClpS